jgi:hypothetical protein
MRAAVPKAHNRQSPLSQPRHLGAKIWPPSAWGGSGAGAGRSSKVLPHPVGRDETVALSGNGRYGLSAEQLAQCGDLDLQIAFFDRDVRPDDVQKLVLGNDPVAPVNQRHEQVERARAHLRRLAIDHEPASRRFNDDPAETLLEGLVHARLLLAGHSLARPVNSTATSGRVKAAERVAAADFRSFKAWFKPP